MTDSSFRYPDLPASFASVDIRAALQSRPGRPPDYEAEDRALAVLAAEMAENPQNMLQKLVEIALDLCHADTAGISLLESRDGAELFRWEALAGVFAAQRNNTMPRDASPCGVCIDRDTTQLMYLADRCFPALRADPRFVEALLLPFRCQGRPVGTVWAVMHQSERAFDREDERIMRTLAAFASAGWQLWQANIALSESNAQLGAAQAQLTNLPALLVQAQETERRLLARELHDDFSQHLAALGMTASALAKSSESPESIRQAIYGLSQKIGGLADDIHRISRQLHPAILDDLGLEAALREECRSFSRRHGIPVHFEARDVPRSLPADIALCLFRVTQESFRNIGAHAGATEVRVRLERTPAELVLFIEDSGHGFDLNTRPRGGLGLISMEERVRMLNGDFKIRAVPGVGTAKEFRLPLPDRAS